MNALQLLRFVVLVGLTLAITSADTKLVETDRQLAITIACPQGEGLQNAFYIMTIDLTADDTVCSIEELADMETDFSIALDQYVTGAVKSVPAVTFENNNICSVDGEASAVRLLMMESFQDAFHRRLGFVYRFVGSGKCRFCGRDNGDARRRLVLGNMYHSDEFESDEDGVNAVDQRQTQVATPTTRKSRFVRGSKRKRRNLKDDKDKSKSSGILMDSKNICNCTNYAVEEKLAAACDLCKDPYCSVQSKIDYGCDLCKDEWIGPEPKIDFGCDLCLDPWLKKEPKAEFGCDICVDKWLVVKDKREFGCLICEMDSISNEDKAKEGCFKKDYNICNDKYIYLAVKRNHGCFENFQVPYDVCRDNNARKEDKKTANCKDKPVKFSYGDIMKAVQTETEEQKLRSYVKGAEELESDPITIIVYTDNLPRETRIEITDVNNDKDPVWTSDKFTQPNTRYDLTVWIDRTKDYEFTVFDSGGDGMCCFEGQGNVTVYIGDEPDLENDIPIICEHGNFGANSKHDLDLDEVTNNPFLSYVPTLERELSDYLSRLIEGTWGAKPGRGDPETCLTLKNPSVKVNLKPTSAEGANVVCDIVNGAV